MHLSSLRRSSDGPHDEGGGSAELSPKGPPTEEYVIGALRDACRAQPALERVLLTVFSDSRHPLNLRASLLNPRRSATCLSEIHSICDYRAVDQRDFEAVVERTSRLPSPLFVEFADHIPIAENVRRFDSRFLSNYGAIASIGPAPSDEERFALESFVDQLRSRVMVDLRDLLKEIAGEPGLDGYPLVNTRSKDGDGILEKITRMRQGNGPKPPRDGYQFSDMPDALGGRITVTLTTDSPRELDILSQRLESVCSEGILERDSFYANRAKRSHPYRVVAYTLGIDGARAEVQLTSLASSIAADLAHNTLHKPLIPLKLGEAEEIMLFWRKATVRELEIFERYHGL